MDQLHEYCARMLGDREAATWTVQDVRQVYGPAPLDQLPHLVQACRTAEEETGPPLEPEAPAGDGMAAAVVHELSRATGRLPQRQREALALRELVGLSHGQMARAIGIEPAAAASLLARARLRLRAELRGTAEPASDCPERHRALRTVTLRQDGETVSGADEDWLMDHLGHCDGCARSHAAMLEASVCYRAWPASAVVLEGAPASS
jgi:Sigma-70, region 4